MKRIGLLSVTLAAMLAVACSGNDRREDANKPADTPAVGTAGSEANREISSASRTWLEDRMKGNMAEVKLGELAGQKAQNADVKAFGRMMVQDHTRANNELKDLASKHNITPPVEVSGDDADFANKLAEKRAGEFDRDYISKMVDGHQATLEALEDRLDKTGDDKNPMYTAKKADDPIDMELNQWAAQTVQTVRRHLDKAKELSDRLSRRTTDNR